MRRFIYFIFFVVAFSLVACSTFLDSKPDSSLAIPNNVQDLQALLDHEDRMNMQCPAAGDIAADYYFMEDAMLATRTVDARDTYTWRTDAQNLEDWSYAYTKILTANVVLDEIDKAELGNMTEIQKKDVKGRALFFRGWTYLQLSQFYTPYYAIGMEDSEYGLPLRLTADINEPTRRSSVKETYYQIINDLSRSVHLLPDRSNIATRPSRAAAYAALSRLYLVVADYEKSLAYTDSCLQIHAHLTDYNTLDQSSNSPFTVLNEEVIFHAVALGTSGVHSQARAFVVPQLRERFDDSDLRKKLFFREDKSGYFRFKGSPSGSTASIFAGLSLDEVYLIRSECQARLGYEADALQTLNILLVNFWEKDRYQPLSDLEGEKLLFKIFDEREKQLMFRGGIRWSDLRRYNTDDRFSKHLVRQVGEETYNLPPGDLRYTFLIPNSVVEISGLKQNLR